jgi:hypothetical protein
MNNPHTLDSAPADAACDERDQAMGPISAEGMRSLIVRSRAIGDSEARLAAAIDASGPRQSDEDAFTLPPRATSVTPAREA